MKLMIKHKIMAVGLIAALVPIFVTSIVTLQKKSDVNQTILEQMEDLSRNNISRISKDVYGLCQTTYDIIQMWVQNGLSTAEYILESNGGLSSSSSKMTWTAINQYTKSSSMVELPKLKIGNSFIEQNFDFNQSTPVVDEVQKKAGTTCTIFQRMNDEGDFIRVATNIRKLDDTRAIGTFIPAVNPDGQPNP